ncbi:MAG: HEAT repeat domain-containing protein [Planctomycetes bacterium]|nr:HEAT repeat domain-containing protein [Planctomycetota bacterium]
MASGSGMSNVAKIGILLVLGGLGFAGWKLYSAGLKSKDDAQLFEMVGAGGAAAKAAELELAGRAMTGKISAETLRGHLKDASPKSRIAAINGLASKKDKDSAKDLIGILEDPKQDVEVHEAACNAFAKIRVKEAVGPLIAEVRNSKSEAVRQAASNSLREVTGQPYSNKEVDKWELWWGENSKTFVVKDK